MCDKKPVNLQGSLLWKALPLMLFVLAGLTAASSTLTEPAVLMPQELLKLVTHVAGSSELIINGTTIVHSLFSRSARLPSQLIIVGSAVEKHQALLDFSMYPTGGPAFVFPQGGSAKWHCLPCSCTSEVVQPPDCSLQPIRSSMSVLHCFQRLACCMFFACRWCTTNQVPPCDL